MAGKSLPVDGERTRLVLKYAVVSRVLVIMLIVLWRSMLNSYDTSASIDPDCLSSSSTAERQQVLLPRVASAVEDSVVWDSVYFVRIARCGYEYEQSYAFLPLLPICISIFSRTVFLPLVPVIGHRAVLALSGYVINNVVFVIAALFFYRLSVLVLKDAEVALRATILFCFNPASIFYSSIYSESLYALLSVSGLYNLVSGGNNLATLFFALSGSARSNGVLNAGYFCFQTMHLVYNAIFLEKRVHIAVQVAVYGVLRCFFIFLPFVSFQAYGYWNICRGLSEDNLRPWCKAKPPLLYNYIQDHYWGVGFMRYFQVKQLPNFLLASPVLCLALFSIIHCVHLWPRVFFSLGLSCNEFYASTFSFDATSQWRTGGVSPTESSRCEDARPVGLRKRSIKRGELMSAKLDNILTSSGPVILPVTVLPFILHLSFMAATAFLVMHVQVATRFLSASPPLYWFASYIMGTPRKKKWGHVIWSYCISYIFLGSLLFSNFYPFT